MAKVAVAIVFHVSVVFLLMPLPMHVFFSLAVASVLVAVVCVLSFRCPVWWRIARCGFVGHSGGQHGYRR